MAWLAAHLPSDPTLLVLLKYLGLILAAGASFWATVNVLTVSDKAGRKRLTTAGRFAIGLTIAGLIVSVTFEDLQRRHAEQVTQDQIAAEAQRTNRIIVAAS